MYCLSPPMEEVPQGDWFCPQLHRCRERRRGHRLQQRKDVHRRRVSLALRSFDASFWGSKEAAAAASDPDIEEAFWRMVEEGQR